LSYAPLADQFAEAQNTEVLADGLAGVDIELKEQITRQLHELYERYIRVPLGSLNRV